MRSRKTSAVGRVPGAAFPGCEPSDRQSGSRCAVLVVADQVERLQTDHQWPCLSCRCGHRADIGASCRSMSQPRVAQVAPSMRVARQSRNRNAAHLIQAFIDSHHPHLLRRELQASLLRQFTPRGRLRLFHVVRHQSRLAAVEVLTGTSTEAGPPGHSASGAHDLMFYTRSASVIAPGTAVDCRRERGTDVSGVTRRQARRARRRPAWQAGSSRRGGARTAAWGPPSSR